MILRADSLLVRLTVLALLGIVVAQVLGAAGIAGLLFTMTFLLTAALWLVTVEESGCDFTVLWIMLLACTAVALNALLTGTAVSFSYVKKLIMFCTTILLFGAAERFVPRAGDAALMLRGNTVLACFLTGMYLWQREQMHLLGGRVTGYLTFRFTNPNLAAVFLCAVCMLELIRAAASRGNCKKWGHILLAVVMGWFVWETQARNARLLLAVFLPAYLLLCLRPGWQPRFRGRMAALAAVSPLLFALGYLLLVYTPAAQCLFSFLTGEGKDLDSRVGIWRFALEAFAASPLTGAYSQISEGTGASQMHNSLVDILASYGAPVCILVCMLLFRLLYCPRDRREGRCQFLCRAGFAALLLSGLGEAMLFSGGMGICLFAGILRMLANYDFERERIP